MTIIFADKNPLFITDNRYTLQAKKELDLEVFDLHDPLIDK